jgi:hypothetical protein
VPTNPERLSYGGTEEARAHVKIQRLDQIFCRRDFGRQTGKSTLLQRMPAFTEGSIYRTLNDFATLAGPHALRLAPPSGLEVQPPFRKCSILMKRPSERQPS